MQFPHINRIEDVLPHIEGKEEIRAIRKDGYTVIDYLFAGKDTFESDNPLTKGILRECRGLIFSKEGWLVRRAFHKFFNMGEKPEVSPEIVCDNFSTYKVYTKYDGSMVTPLFLDGTFNMATRNGITDQSIRALNYIYKTQLRNKNTDIEDYCYNMVVGYNLIPIFEYQDPENPIVLQHEEESLILLALRHLNTGIYYPVPKEVKDSFKSAYRYPVVNYPKLLQIQAAGTDREGYVLYSKETNAPVCKVKLDWYVKLHRAKDKINSAHGIIEAIMDGTLDDVKPLLSGTLARFVADIEEDFFERVKDKQIIIRAQYRHLKAHTTSRKEFALAIQHVDSYTKSILFKMLDDHDLTETLQDVILKNLSSKKFDTFNEVFLHVGKPSLSTKKLVS